MNLGLLLRTVSHLRLVQVMYQVKNRLIHPSYKALVASDRVNVHLKTAPIPKRICLEGKEFTFLNIKHGFEGWNYTGNGMLWAYNQNYFDWINQNGFPEDEGCRWIDKFIDELSTNRIGLDPYPIALRCINWIKFFSLYPGSATKTRIDSLYSQLMFLNQKLEYHLLGNHLLEDAYALYMGAGFFHDEELFRKADRLLLTQLKEQVLSDGAHYEQSPMYHCILLDRLLDCININSSPELEQFASRMLGHLESIVWADGRIPILNDSAYEIAPDAYQLMDYARRLGLSWTAVPMDECGYRKLKDDHLEAIVDVGSITACYQPGHSHADTFNYELRIDGNPFVVDTGISTYNKNSRRQLERSTIAHNTVTVDEKNSSEVWGGFRVGRRASVKIGSVEYREDSHSIVKCIDASHNGFHKCCSRRFEIADGSFAVEDMYDGQAVSYIHLANGADERHISIEEGAERIDIRPWKYSTEYNQFHDGKVMEISFSGKLRYKIK